MYEERDREGNIYNAFRLAGPGTYDCWVGMKQRCLNPNSSNYSRYGARGITVCARWLVFNNFYEDMGDKPEGLTLERINNEQGYSPSNCKWATYSEQNRNRRAYGKHSKYQPRLPLTEEEKRSRKICRLMGL